MADMESTLRGAVLKRTERESINAIAVAAEVDPGQLYRFSRGERTLRLPAASRLANYLGLELCERTPARKKSGRSSMQ